MVKLVVVAMVVVALMAVEPCRAAADLTCATKLIACSSAFGPNATQPTSSCCGPMRELVGNPTQLSCLCTILESNVLQGLNITRDDAYRVAGECGVTNTNLCGTNATSPTLSPTAGSSTPVSDASYGAEWIGIPGIMSLFVALWSLLMA